MNTFYGTTICNAFIQAAGMVDDHLEGCFRKGTLTQLEGEVE